MSRIGKLPDRRSRRVSTSPIDGQLVTVKGPKGTLSPHRRRADHGRPKATTASSRSSAPTTSARAGSLHGLTRTLINNMVVGVTEGYEKKLEIVGVGYRVLSKGPTQLEFQLGYSHSITFNAPEGITFTVEGPTRLGVQGIDKQLVGEVAANIRKLRKPEPYKGKGVRYAGEHIRRKVGKAGK